MTGITASFCHVITCRSVGKLTMVVVGPGDFFQGNSDKDWAPHRKAKVDCSLAISNLCKAVLLTQ